MVAFYQKMRLSGIDHLQLNKYLRSSNRAKMFVAEALPKVARV